MPGESFSKDLWGCLDLGGLQLHLHHKNFRKNFSQSPYLYPMAKVRKIEHIYQGEKYHHDQYEYMCLGCGYTHVFALTHEGGHHQWNNDYDNPTVTPSLVQNFTPGSMCHSFIRNGHIQYLTDCTHHLAGQTISLPDLPKKDLEVSE